MGSHVPVMNESMNEMIYEMNHKKLYCTADMKSSEAMTLAVSFITAGIIPSLDFISAVQRMIHFIDHFVQRKQRQFFLWYLEKVYLERPQHCLRKKIYIRQRFSVG